MESLDGYFLSFSAAQLESIRAIAMDMWPPYISSTLRHVPGARDKIVFDPYHIMSYMNEAVDDVRKREHREYRARGDETLARSRYLWLYAQELISAIGNAEKQVYLTNAYFVPDPQLLKSLIDAVGRGVDVKLILPSHSDSAVVFHAGRSHYSGLLEGGVKLYERVGALLHSKTAVIDGVWSTVGSINLDWRSFLDNDELNAVILGREFGQKMQVMFAKDLDVSEAIDLERWQRRPLSFRFKEWMARVWGRLL